jgi:hypothetical protein
MEPSAGLQVVRFSAPAETDSNSAENHKQPAAKRKAGAIRTKLPAARLRRANYLTPALELARLCRPFRMLRLGRL